MRFLKPEWERSDETTIRSLQLSRVRSVLESASHTNPFYKARLDAAGVKLEDITSLEAFGERVPTVGKQDFLADQREAPPYGRRHEHVMAPGAALFVYTTSGTSGQGQEFHMQSAEEFKRTTSEVYPYLFRWSALDPGDTLFLAMPVTMLGGGRLEYHGALDYGLTVYPVGNYDAARKIELLEQLQPQGVLANTSYLGRLGALLNEDVKRAPAKALLTGGEGSGLAWLERLQHMWGAPVFDRYGCSQAGNDHMFSCEQGIGTRDRPGMLHNIDPMMLVEVVDPVTGKHVADGEQGELVLTSLYRPDTPLIRCRVGDRAVYRSPRYCSCRRPFRGVEVASIARTDDMKKIKGVAVWPKAVDDVIFRIPEVQEYQVVLTSSEAGLDVATLRATPRAEMEGEASERLREHIAAELHRRIGIHFGVEILQHGGPPVDEWKARRWLDQREIMR